MFDWVWFAIILCVFIGLLGAMFWALDFDDFNGNECGEGKYPLIKAVNRALEGEVPTETPTKMPSASTTSTESSFRSTSTEQSQSGSCHSVPPYESPDMDEWCKENCALGYCPETHCICDWTYFISKINRSTRIRSHQKLCDLFYFCTMNLSSKYLPMHCELFLWLL